MNRYYILALSLFLQGCATPMTPAEFKTQSIHDERVFAGNYKTIEQCFIGTVAYNSPGKQYVYDGKDMYGIPNVMEIWFKDMPGHKTTMVDMVMTPHLASMKTADPFSTFKSCANGKEPKQAGALPFYSIN